MTDTAKVTVSFSQKVSEAAYETADYSLSIERVVPESMGDGAILAEANAMFAEIKNEVLKQAGQEIDLTPDGVVMRRLKSGVSRASNNQASATTPSAPSGPTATSVAAAPVPSQSAPSGGTISGRVYKRVDFCLGRNAEQNQTAFNLLAFQPNEWADEEGGIIKVYEVKEKADGSTDVTKNGKNFPNFSVTKDALARLGMQVARDVGIWVNDGDSNVPLKVWDEASGQSKEDAIEWDWLGRRDELQQFAYKGN
jgi:hypothetical protein